MFQEEVLKNKVQRGKGLFNRGMICVQAGMFCTFGKGFESFRLGKLLTFFYQSGKFDNEKSYKN